MLKPKYGTINESVSDFNRMLEGMNKTQPLDRYAVDQEVRARQQEDRLRRELRHVESVIAGSGHFFTEREKAEWYTKRAQIAEMLGEDPEPISESVAGAPPRGGNPISRFRVLAGLEEQIMMPRDPGLSGTTRHNYDSMMESFEESDDVEEAYSSAMVRRGAQRAEKKGKKAVTRSGIALRPEDDVPEKKSVSRHGAWKQASAKGIKMPQKESSNRFRGISRLKR